MKDLKSDWPVGLLKNAKRSVRRQPSSAQQTEIAKLQENRCFYCWSVIGSVVRRGHREVHLQPHWDHKVPHSSIKENPSHNWCLACHICNLYKGNRLFKSADAARAYIAKKRKTNGFEINEENMKINLKATSTVPDNQMAMDVSESEESSVWALLKEFAALKNQLEDIETKIAPVRAQLMNVVIGLGGELEMGGYRAVVNKVERQNFDLKLAMSRLDKRILRPFINHTTYNAIRLTRKV